MSERKHNLDRRDLEKVKESTSEEEPCNSPSGRPVLGEEAGESLEGTQHNLTLTKMFMVFC